MTREQLFAEANIPDTPANAAQRFYEIMAAPGNLQQLRQLRTSLLGGTDVNWNKSVLAAYYSMYGQRLQNEITIYVSNNI